MAGVTLKTVEVAPVGTVAVAGKVTSVGDAARVIVAPGL